MEKLLKGKDEEYIRDLFAKNLVDEVRLTLVTQSSKGKKVSKNNEQYLPYTESIVNEVAALSEKIKVQTFRDDEAKEKEYEVKEIPALFIEGRNTNKNVVYYGIPSGHEFSSLLEDIIDASKGSTGLPESIKNQVKKISSPVEILVFVTPTCPYCPKAVRTAHQFAMENHFINGVMIEANEFPDWSNEKNVSAVPKIVINDIVQFEGALPEDAFLNSVYEALGIKLA